MFQILRESDSISDLDSNSKSDFNSDFDSDLKYASGSESNPHSCCNSHSGFESDSFMLLIQILTLIYQH